MNSPSERIRSLIQSGKVTQEEGDRLLLALSRANEASLGALFVNPFVRFGGGFAAGAGLVIALLSAWATRLGIRYDGFLDLHAARNVISLPVAGLEQGVAWILPAALFWGFALAVGCHARLIDFLGMTGLARLPHLLVAAPLSLLAPAHTDPNVAPKIGFSLVLIATLAIGCVAWNVTWLYQGFRNASGLNGKKLVLGFIGIVIASEVASKVVLEFVS